MELLNDMALFVEVVKAKGFRSAAEVMGMPNSTLSRRISALEKAIGLRLLHRTTRKIELTEAHGKFVLTPAWVSGRNSLSCASSRRRGGYGKRACA